MRLATLRTRESRDGALLVAHPDGRRAARVPADIAPDLRTAVEAWEGTRPRLRKIEKDLINGKNPQVLDLDSVPLMAPLPRTWGWLDGSAFIHHILLARQARGAEPPADLRSIPLMYQGTSDNLLGPNDDIPLLDEAHGMDFEAEVAVVLGDVPAGSTAANAAGHVRLLLLMNDVSLRQLIPRELATSFGFIHGKPPSSFAPFAVTPDELGADWVDGRVQLELEVRLNGERFGSPHGGEMHFSFFDLIAHAARTRPLAAGTILGSGTFSNAEEARGSGCIVERRMIETIKTGKPSTPFLKPGDRVEMDMRRSNRSVFGVIRQRVVKSGP